MMREEHVKKCVRLLVEQQRDLYGQECERIDVEEILTDPNMFLFSYVKQNRPLVIRNAVNYWPALQLWSSDQYLIDKMGEKTVSVAASPSGRVDAIHGDYFVEPEVRNMTLSQFFKLLSSDAQEILYIQQQNGNLYSEFEELTEDIDLEYIKLISGHAFHTDVDAANIWIGTQDSVSSAHKDHYENLYVQVCGRKIFYLLPPSAVANLDIKMYKSAKYSKNQEKWEVITQQDETTVPWIKKDLRKIYEQKNEPGLYPMKVVLNPGEVLYLPALWYHQVEQENDDYGRVIAVNFWFDMTYDQNYHYFQFLENLVCEWKKDIVDDQLSEYTDDNQEI